MRAKHVANTSRRQGHSTAKRSMGLRKASTYRLDPLLQKELAFLGKITKTSGNRMVNNAVAEYLRVLAADVEADLEETLRRVKEYRKADPNFESAIARFAKAEAGLAGEDPVEGKTAPAAGPAQILVRELIRG